MNIRSIFFIKQILNHHQFPFSVFIQANCKNIQYPLLFPHKLNLQLFVRLGYLDQPMQQCTIIINKPSLTNKEPLKSTVSLFNILCILPLSPPIHIQLGTTLPCTQKLTPRELHYSYPQEQKMQMQCNRLPLLGGSTQWH